MAKGDPEDSKLLLLPRRLVDRLDELARRRNVSITSLAVDALEQTLRASDEGISLGDAVGLHELMQVQRRAGCIEISRSSFESMVRELFSEGADELKSIWRDSGAWYGAYISAKLKGKDVLDFFERALLISWNLDEALIEEEGGEVRVRCTSFTMPLETTELLVSYVSGVMSSLGYDQVDRDYLRGIAILTYAKRLEKKSP